MHLGKKKRNTSSWDREHLWLQPLPLAWHWFSLRFSPFSVTNTWLSGMAVWEMEDSRQPAHVVKCAVVLQQCAPGIFCSGLYVSYAFCITSGDPIASSRSLDTHSFEARLGDLPTSLSLCGESSVSCYVKGASHLCWFSFLSVLKKSWFTFWFYMGRNGGSAREGNRCLPPSCHMWGAGSNTMRMKKIMMPSSPWPGIKHRIYLIPHLYDNSWREGSFILFFPKKKLKNRQIRNWLKGTEQVSGRGCMWSSAVKNQMLLLLPSLLGPFGCGTPCPRHRVSQRQPCTGSRDEDSWSSARSAPSSTIVLFLSYVQGCGPVLEYSLQATEWKTIIKEPRKGGGRWKGEAHTLFIALDLITKDLQSSQKIRRRIMLWLIQQWFKPPALPAVSWGTHSGLSVLYFRAWNKGFLP